MESVGRLAGGIAHEFNNLLTAINGYAEFLKEELIGQLPLLHDVNEIMRAGGRATVLTRQLLIFARQQTVELIPLRLNDVIVEVGAMPAFATTMSSRPNSPSPACNAVANDA